MAESLTPDELLAVLLDYRTMLADLILKAKAQGLNHYRQRQFTGASAYFARTLELLPQDVPSGLYFNRCEKYKKDPPLETWEPVTLIDEFNL
jgi:hypothetical protein